MILASIFVVPVATLYHTVIFSPTHLFISDEIHCNVHTDLFQFNTLDYKMVVYIEVFNNRFMPYPEFRYLVEPD